MNANKGAVCPEEKFPCPCCGQKLFARPTPGSWEICPLCDWEDEPVQYADPDFPGGANPLSLNRAKRQFEGLFVGGNKP